VRRLVDIQEEKIEEGRMERTGMMGMGQMETVVVGFEIVLGMDLVIDIDIGFGIGWDIGNFGNSEIDSYYLGNLDNLKFGLNCVEYCCVEVGLYEKPGLYVPLPV